MPLSPKSGRDSLSTRLVRVATVGTMLLWVWFMCFFMFPRVEELFAALHVNESGPNLPHLIYAFRTTFKTLFLCIGIAAVWILLSKDGKRATNLLAALLFLLLIEIGVVMYAVIFMPLGGLSSSIH